MARPKKEEQNNNSPAVDRLTNDILAKFGSGAVFSFNDNTMPDVDWVSTTSLELDRILGGGVARGRIIEIQGNPSAGKTTLAMHILAEIQKLEPDKHCAVIDFESALDIKYIKNLGVNLDKLLISQSETAEEGLEIIDMMVRSGVIPCIIIDSVAAMVPRAELEGEMDQQQVGLQARLMSKALRKITNLVKQNNMVIIFTNQYRDNIKTFGFGPPGKVTSGGHALSFYASQRIELVRTGSVKRGEEAIANKIKVKIIKNKVACPLKQCDIILTFGKGIDADAELIDLAIQYKLIKKAGPWLSIPNPEDPESNLINVQGTQKMEEALNENIELKQQLLRNIKELIRND